MPSNDPPTPEVCPVCGAEVPPRRLACPECGADHNSGWNEEALIYDGLDLPDEAFEDEGSARDDAADQPKPGLNSWLSRLATLGFLIAFLYYLFGH